ncbi:hypothetical protein [Marmoricola sp. URHB0036]|uniref:hypothetical protein n=1 Tax=Marmoricola sp. URHB0036 TaxID=1298863 RepID=UPI0012DF523B|nr:hypothetical protein [Marmoricola sp. URHB0036]
MFSDHGYIYGFTFNRAVLAVVAVVLSVQLGRGVWRTGALIRRSLVLRLALVALNLFAIALIPVMVQRFLVVPGWLSAGGSSDYVPPADGLAFNGEPVANVYPYDAQGHLLTGVQLIDRQGRRLSVTRDPYGEGTGWGEFRQSPWLNGRIELYSVFPLPEQKLDPSTGEPTGEARIQVPPFAALSPVTLADAHPSVLMSPGQLEARLKAAAAQATKRAKHRFVSPGQR